ncbi:MAG: hypothetical protein ACRCZF_08855, partial [Gemmataceae bacterium]
LGGDIIEHGSRHNWLPCFSRGAGQTHNSLSKSIIHIGPSRGNAETQQARGHILFVAYLLDTSMAAVMMHADGSAGGVACNAHSRRP